LLKNSFLGGAALFSAARKPLFSDGLLAPEGRA
jgi:hypothetical protein